MHAARMTLKRYAFSAIAVLILGLGTAGLRAAEPAKPDILFIGDSLFASNSQTDQAISDQLSRILNVPVADRSVLGAKMIYRMPITAALGLSIPVQYRDQKWRWVVVNGGGNDLWLGCGCNKCDRKIEALISSDGSSGEIPRLVARIRKTGTQVLFVGYLRSPGFGSPIEHCRDDGEALEARIAALAKVTKGLTFLSLADLVPDGDLTYHAFDRIHPSLKGSDAIARRISGIVKAK